MKLFGYKRATNLMEKDGIDVILAHTCINTGYIADYYCHFIFQPSFILDDGSMTYISFVGLPKEESKNPFHVAWTGEEGDITASKPWIEDIRYYGRDLPILGREKQSPLDCIDPIDCVVNALKERGLEDKTIGLEMRYISVDIYNQLKVALPRATFKDAIPTILNLRMIKSPIEIERMKRAAEVTERAIKYAFDSVYPGMNELEFDRKLKKSLGEDGAGYKWAHVAFGPKGATSIFPTDNQVQPGQIIRVDHGGAYGKYVCDMSRVAVLGEPTTEVLKVYDACLQTYRAVEEETGPGVRASDLHRIATATMKQAGYQLFSFMVGHGIGRDVHEQPFLVPGVDTLLEPGMVLDIEIPMRVMGLGSINIEDEVLITENGKERINIWDQELNILKSSL